MITGSLNIDLFEIVDSTVCGRRKKWPLFFKKSTLNCWMWLPILYPKLKLNWTTTVGAGIRLKKLKISTSLNWILCSGATSGIDYRGLVNVHQTEDTL